MTAFDCFIFLEERKKIRRKFTNKTKNLRKSEVKVDGQNDKTQTQLLKNVAS